MLLLLLLLAIRRGVAGHFGADVPFEETAAGAVGLRDGARVEGHVQERAVAAPLAELLTRGRLGRARRAEPLRFQAAKGVEVVRLVGVQRHELRQNARVHVLQLAAMRLR